MDSVGSMALNITREGYVWSKKSKLLNFESLSTELKLSNLILETMKAIIVFESHNL